MTDLAPRGGRWAVALVVAAMALGGCAHVPRHRALPPALAVTDSSFAATVEGWSCSRCRSATSSDPGPVR